MTSGRGQILVDIKLQHPGRNGGIEESHCPPPYAAADERAAPSRFPPPGAGVRMTTPATTPAQQQIAQKIAQQIADELGVRAQQVAAAVELLDGGATVPFVARYRKEATGALDDAQLRALDERLRYLRELDERRAAILDSIAQQGKLDATLKHAIDTADSKALLEDLYLPYRPKRRTKAQIACEAGLEPLAMQLYQNPSLNPAELAANFI